MKKRATSPGLLIGGKWVGRAAGAPLPPLGPYAASSAMPCTRLRAIGGCDPAGDAHAQSISIAPEIHVPQTGQSFPKRVRPSPPHLRPDSDTVLRNLQSSL
jgi:hypothetical protein